MSKVDLQYLFSPKGTNSIDGGIAPGLATTIRPTLRGLHNPDEIQPFTGLALTSDLYPGALPPAIEFVPFGDGIGRGLSFDTPSRAMILRLRGKVAKRMMDSSSKSN